MKLSYFSAQLSGRRMPKTALPSSGGIGIRLKTARMALTQTIACKRCSRGKKNPPGERRGVAGMNSYARKAKRHTKANNKFENGPAPATRKWSNRPCLKFLGSIGTGFAQPNTGAPVREATMGRIMVPMMSACTRGFKDKRPMAAAVSSPRSLAIKACAAS